MKKFWNWIRDETEGRILRLEGPIDAESYWGDEITPADFRADLEADEGDITVWINSPGGNVFAAAEIYTMLREYAGNVTVRIASIAASAASVVAMAGNQVEMSPTALLMVHDPSTIAMGNAKDMEKAIQTLNEVKESIINAYAAKSGMRRSKIAEMMSNETWMDAKKAVEYGFADKILFEEKKTESEEQTEAGEAPTASLYSTRLMDQAILNRLGIVDFAEEPVETEKTGSEETVSEEPPSIPSIGMDGKTEDGAMPYEIVRKQLEFLK